MTAGRLVPLVIGLCVVVALVAACGGSSRPRTIGVTVIPTASVEEQTLEIEVRGLSPHEVVSLSLASTDAMGVRWMSAARFAASSTGTVDVGRAAPLSGSYTGVWEMGLLAMMQPLSRDPAGAYVWADDRPMRFAVSIQARQRKLASKAFTRRFSTAALSVRSLSLRQSGLVGRFVYPTGAKRRPAIVVLGGSEGGVPGALASNPLAAHDYAVLTLGYFKLPGLPQQLLRIPLEYFERAFQWLRRQPQVDPSHIVVMGTSYGSEAALLSGAYFPRLVNAVVAMVPGDAATCSFPGCLGPAWTFHGRAVPFTVQFSNPQPSDNPNAVIPVQRIRGPVFLACGTKDAVWPSCAYSRAIMSHLHHADDRFSHILYAYPGAGHYVASFLPYEPAVNTPNYVGIGGGSLQADQQGRALDWPRLLDFLAAFARSR